MSSNTLSFRTLESRHIPEAANDLIHSLSYSIIDGVATGDMAKPRRMVALRDNGVLKVFSEYENGFDEPFIRLKYFFTEGDTKVAIKAIYTELDRVTQHHAAVLSRTIEDIDIADVSALIRFGLWGPEDDDDEDYFDVDDDGSH